MPDDTEILLQEVAVLRGELADLRTTPERAQESIRNDVALILERLDTLTVLIETRIPPPPQ